MNEQTDKGLADAKAGDTVILDLGGLSGGKSVAKIDRTTATQIIIGHRRFARRDGYAVGSNSWNRAHIWPPREGEIEKIAREQHRRDLLCKLRNTDWSKLSTERLEQVIGALG